MNKKITPQTFPAYTPNPIFVGLPKYLKDPANFVKIQKMLLDILAGQHTHSEVLGWASCVTCQNKAKDLKLAIQKLGFKGPAQYYAWKKIMDVLVYHRRSPLRSK